MSSLTVLDPRAAFVDVGSEKMHVSIAGEPPVVFGTVTSQLHALRDYLAGHQVRSVAMEATGVYWLPLYGVLEAAGLEVVMVDGRQTRNLPGRKTDMKDCQWGATLHAHGLLRAGFVPPAHVRRLQDYLRLRGEHIAAAAGHVQHMQKALERMNVKLHEVISSLTGASGLAVIRAVLAGERDPQVLLGLCDVQIRKVKAERVVESLRGNWAEEHLFALEQAVQSWDHYQSLIAACDRQIEVVLRQMPDTKVPPPAASSKKGRRRTRAGVNAPDIADLRELLAQICGAKDLTTLPAHTEYSVLQLMGEVGTDLTKWPTEKHFTSWLGIAPGSAQSGKRKGRVKRRRNRAGRIFGVMARSLVRSKHVALGGFYRRLAARRGGLVANKALARKLATLFWRVMVKGLDFVETGVAQYEAKVLETKHRTLRRLARQLGQQIVPNPATSA
ncbi:IS110 family transposase [Bradyrhizobium sp. INPA01-394B]|uniref:IS110 family transposase n=1 Tax=Bradyrhizobium campsiandrae TaxID=1729892 RepID=A0ABR7UIB7_9BRAD|nr:IS110 family transposase [Bradyrhizobium campsiandrae]MBC9883614.1 IS110 family transposase [Bradyrhizobium campsiandrae]MBC9983157.1 IS110 family transposase [Bradyrhizobium campsiandrae]